MDRFEDYIGLVLQGVHVNSVRRRELEDELRDHLDLLKRELLQEGYPEDQAEVTAIERFGGIDKVQRGFQKFFTPLTRFRDTLHRKKVLKEALQWTAMLAVALFVSLSIRSYAFAATEVKQRSMQSTLFEGQHLIENKLEYSRTEPKRGDIIVINRKAEKGVFRQFAANAKEFFEGFFRQEDEERTRLIKRVIGVPGDVLDIRDGKVFINGRLLDEPYVQGSTLADEGEFPLTIPEKEYFVMGDNREESMDSRDIGLIGLDSIEGKAIWRIWPVNKFGGLSD